MQSALYVALSAQVALSNRLETVSRNVANMNTAGYRADEVKFAEILSKAGADKVSYATGGEIYISRQHGSLNKTDNPLDLAVEGDAFFAIRMGEEIAYTRDGRLQMDPEGVLRTVGGYEILDAGGLPIQLDPQGGPPYISPNGDVIQRGEDAVGAVGMFLLPQEAQLTRRENSSIMSDLPAVPVQVFDVNAVRQGYVEGANINPIREMTKMIMITRSFEGATKMMTQSDETQQRTIRELGKTS